MDGDLIEERQKIEIRFITKSSLKMQKQLESFFRGTSVLFPMPKS
jgi:hypothetical protein